MIEILQAEIVAYSSAVKIFVNGLSRRSDKSAHPVRGKTVDKIEVPRNRATGKAFRADSLWKN
jgi:hypothetical protein